MPFKMRVFGTRIFLWALLSTALIVPALATDAFVSNEKGNSVSVLNLETLTVKKTIAVGQRPRGIIASPDGKIVYVALGDDDMITTIDPQNLKVTGSFSAGHDPERIEISPDG